MHDPKNPKPGLRPGAAAPQRPTPSAPGMRPGAAPAARPAAAPVRPQAAPPSRPGAAPGARPGEPAAPSGKVRHDERGNAVWDFIATTSRVCIEATSRLLKKLEAPELKIEDDKDEELRITPEPSTGGGYDPYNQSTKPSRSGRK